MWYEFPQKKMAPWKMDHDARQTRSLSTITLPMTEPGLAGCARDTPLATVRRQRRTATVQVLCRDGVVSSVLYLEVNRAGTGVKVER